LDICRFYISKKTADSVNTEVIIDNYNKKDFLHEIQLIIFVEINFVYLKGSGRDSSSPIVLIPTKNIIKGREPIRNTESVNKSALPNV